MNKVALAGKIAILLILLALLSPPAVYAKDVDWFTQPGGKYIADTEFVKGKVDAPGWVIIDVRTSADFEKEHIKGTNVINLYYDALRDATKTLFKKPDGTIDVEKYEKLLGAAGLTEATNVILYGKKGDYHVTVIFWILKVLGHKGELRVYNGGIESWKAAGYPIESGKVTPKAATYKATLTLKYYASTSFVVKVAQAYLAGSITPDKKFIICEDKKVVLLDVRTIKEYVGTDIRSLRGGTIPGSKLFPLFVFWEGSDDPDKAVLGELKKPADILAILTSYTKKYAGIYSDKYEGLTLDDLRAADIVIVFCQTGTRATYAFWVLQMLGLDNVAIHDDSWIIYGSNVLYPAENESWLDLYKMLSDIKSALTSIEDLSKRVDALEKSLSDALTTIKGISDTIKGISDTLDKRTSALEARIKEVSDSVDKRISALEGAVGTASSTATASLVLAIIALVVAAYSATLARKRR